MKPRHPFVGPLLTTSDAISLGRRRGSGVLHDLGQEIVLPGTDNGLDDLAILEEDEGRHRLDFVGYSNFLLNKGIASVHHHGGHCATSARFLLQLLCIRWPAGSCWLGQQHSKLLPKGPK